MRQRTPDRHVVRDIGNSDRRELIVVLVQAAIIGCADHCVLARACRYRVEERGLIDRDVARRPGRPCFGANYSLERGGAGRAEHRPLHAPARIRQAGKNLGQGLAALLVTDAVTVTARAVETRPLSLACVGIDRLSITVTYATGGTDCP